MSNVALLIRYFEEDEELEVFLRVPQIFTIREVCEKVVEKIGYENKDYGLFLPPSRHLKGLWLNPNATVKFYNLLSGTTLYYKNKYRNINIRLIDGTIKPFIIDDSATVGEISFQICEKSLINFAEEFSLQVEGRPESMSFFFFNYNHLIQYFSKDEWLDPDSTLHEQGVKLTDTLILGKKFYYFDGNIDKENLIQLHIAYTQSKDMLINGRYPLNREEAIKLVSLQMHIEFGNYNEEKYKSKPFDLEAYLHPSIIKKFKNPIDNEVIEEYQKLVGVDESKAKFMYLDTIRNLRTFGITLFECLERGKKKGKWVPVLVGISRDSILRMKPDTYEIIKDYPLKYLKRWAANLNSFTFDFGDYELDYYQVQTSEGDAMSNLISGYIDILVRRKLRIANSIQSDNSHPSQPEALSPDVSSIIEPFPTIYTNSHTLGIALYKNPKGQLPYYENIDLMNVQSSLYLNTYSYIESKKIKIVDLISASQAAFILSEEISKDNVKNGEYGYTFSMDNVSEQIKNTYSKFKPMLKSIEERKPVNLESIQSLIDNLFHLASYSRIFASMDENNGRTIMKCSQNISLSLSKIMKAYHNHLATPENFHYEHIINEEIETLRQNFILLKSTCKGNVNDVHTENLADAMCNIIKDTIKSSIKLCRKTSVQLTRKIPTNILEQYRLTKFLFKSFSKAVKTLSGIIIDVKARNILLKISNNLSDQIPTLYETMKSLDTSREYLDKLDFVFKDITNSIFKFNHSILLAQPKLRVSYLNFKNPHISLLSSISLLRIATNTTQIINSLKSTITSINDLVLYTKHILIACDMNQSERLNKALSSINVQLSNVINLAKEYLINHNNKEYRTQFLNSTYSLEKIVHNIYIDAGSLAAYLNMHFLTKDTLSFSLKLINNLKTCANAIQNTEAIEELMDQISMCESTYQNLFDSLGSAIMKVKRKEPQITLIQNLTTFMVPISRLITTSRRILPLMTFDIDLMNDTNLCIEDLETVLVDLDKAIELTNEILGFKDIDTSIDQISAALSNLKEAEFISKGGFLNVSKYYKRSDSIIAFNQSIEVLLKEINALYDSLEKDKRIITHICQNISLYIAQLSTSVKLVVQTTRLRKYQMNIIRDAFTLITSIKQCIISVRDNILTNNDSSVIIASLYQIQSQITEDSNKLKYSILKLDTMEVSNAINEAEMELKNISVYIPENEDNRSYSEIVKEMNTSSKSMRIALIDFFHNLITDPFNIGTKSNQVISYLKILLQHIKKLSSVCEDSVISESLIHSSTVITKNLIQLLEISKNGSVLTDKSLYDQTNVVLRCILNELDVLSKHHEIPEMTSMTNQLYKLINDIEGYTQSNIKENMNANQIYDVLEHSIYGIGITMSNIINELKINPPDKIITLFKNLAFYLESLSKAAISSTNPKTTRFINDIINSLREIASNPIDKGIILSNKTLVVDFSSRVILLSIIGAKKVEDKEIRKQLLSSIGTISEIIPRFVDTNQSQEYIIERSNELINLFEFVDKYINYNDESSIIINETISIRLIEATKSLLRSVLSFINYSEILMYNDTYNILNSFIEDNNISKYVYELKLISNEMNPNRKHAQSLVSSIQKLICDLDVSNLLYSVGITETNLMVDSKLDIIDVLKDLTQSMTNFINEIKNRENIIETLNLIKKNLEELIVSARSFSLSSSCTELKEKVLSISRNIALSILNIIKSYTNIHSEFNLSQNNIIDGSLESLKLINQLVQLFKENSSIRSILKAYSQKIVESISTIKEIPNSNVDYRSTYNSIINLVVKIAEKISYIDSSDRDDLENTIDQCKQCIETITQLIQAINEIASKLDDKEYIFSLIKEFLSNFSLYIKKLSDKNPLIQESSYIEYQISLKTLTQILCKLKESLETEKSIENSLNSIKESVSIITEHIQLSQLYSKIDLIEDNLLTDSQLNVSISTFKDLVENISVLEIDDQKFMNLVDNISSTISSLTSGILDDTYLRDRMYILDKIRRIFIQTFNMIQELRKHRICSSKRLHENILSIKVLITHHINGLLDEETEKDSDV